MLNSLNALFAIPLVSFFTGAGITWLVAWLYYKKAGDELKAEASRLHRTTEMILRWLEAKGENVSVIRSADGTPTGLAHEVSVAESAPATATTDATVIRNPKTDGH